MSVENKVSVGSGSPAPSDSPPVADPAGAWTQFFVPGVGQVDQGGIMFFHPDGTLKYPGAHWIPAGPCVGNEPPVVSPDAVPVSPAKPGLRVEQAAPAARTESGLTKVSMNFAGPTIDMLRALSKKQGTTMTEVVRRAIGLQNFVAAEMEAGGKILVEDVHGKIKRVVLP